MIRSSRAIIAAVLTAIYLMIVMSPLAAVALHSTVAANAKAVACSGDCSICGCSPERSAAHTCCCWQNRLQHDHDTEQNDPPACCKTKLPAKTKNATCSAPPCNSGKYIAFQNIESPEHLLVRTILEPAPIHEDDLTPYQLRHLHEHHGDTPDPPPKLTMPA